MFAKKSLEKILTLISLLYLAIILFSRFEYSLQKIFDPDEMTHLHTTYLMTVGQLPFRDFFTGHLPFINFLLFPLFKILPEGPAVLIFARIVIFVINCGSLFLLYKIAKKINLPAWAAVTAGILLLVSPFSFERLFEIRPDIPMLFFLLLSLNLFLDFLLNPETPSPQIRSHTNPSAGWRTHQNFKFFHLPVGKCSDFSKSRLLNFKLIFLSGLSLGLANAFLLRSVFAAVVMGAVTLITLIANKRTLKNLYLSVGFFALGIILPLIAVVLFWFITGTLGIALKDIFYYGPQVYATYKTPYHPWVFLGLIHENYSFYETSLFDWFYHFDANWLLLTQITWFVALGVLLKHFLTSLLPKVKLPMRLGSLLLIALTVVYALSIYLYRIYLPQYWLPLILFVSLLAAESAFLLKRLLDFLHPFCGFSFFIIFITFITFIFLSHSFSQLPRFGKNERQLSVLNFILASTQKTDRFYDGIGSYVFRPDCSYTGMATPFEIPKEILKYLIDEVEASHCTGFVWGLYDRMRFWGPGDLDYLKANYAPTENPDVWLPKKTIELTANDSKQIKIIKEGFYYISNLSDLSDLGNLSIDGQQLKDYIYLSSGPHTIINNGLAKTVIINYDIFRNKNL